MIFWDFWEIFWEMFEVFVGANPSQHSNPFTSQFDFFRVKGVVPASC